MEERERDKDGEEERERDKEGEKEREREREREKREGVGVKWRGMDCILLRRGGGGRERMVALFLCLHLFPPIPVTLYMLHVHQQVLFCSSKYVHVYLLSNYLPGRNCVLCFVYNC